MDIRAIEGVHDLAVAENDLCQVLLGRFGLRREGAGNELSLEFGPDSPTIRHRSSKLRLRDRIPDFDGKSRRIQGDLDRFLLEGEGRQFGFDDPDFVFRYGSGGALPVLRFEDRE